MGEGQTTEGLGSLPMSGGPACVCRCLCAASGRGMGGELHCLPPLTRGCLVSVQLGRRMVGGGVGWLLALQFSVVEFGWGEWLLVVVRVQLESCEMPQL
jgi:hypothetical protein